MNAPVKNGSRPQRYTQILLVDDKPEVTAPVKNPVLDELEAINPDEMTPLQALATIADLKRKLKRDGGNP